MEEKKEEKRENELYVKMRENRLTQHETVGDLFKYVRGKGLVKRNELVK
jgi:hypothetical protein